MSRILRLIRKLPAAINLAPREWLDLVHAVGALRHALRQTRRLSAGQVLAAPQPAPAQPLPEATARQVARVRIAVQRAASIVPFRSDCLIQAYAARQWLAEDGIASDLKLGARRDAKGGLDAHAWLVWNGEVVTGGDISGFQPFA